MSADVITYRKMDSAPKDGRWLWVLFADGIERRVFWWACDWLREDDDEAGIEGDPACTDCWRDATADTHEVYDAISWRPCADQD